MIFNENINLLDWLRLTQIGILERKTLVGKACKNNILYDGYYLYKAHVIVIAGNFKFPITIMIYLYCIYMNLITVYTSVGCTNLFSLPTTCLYTIQPYSSSSCWKNTLRWVVFFIQVFLYRCFLRISDLLHLKDDQF